MHAFLSCPSCEGLLRPGRESCPHCDYRPATAKKIAGAAAVISFSAFVACGDITPAVEYGPCVACGPLPDAAAEAGDTGAGDASDAGAGDASDAGAGEAGDAG
jgi:hypothetical protein